MRIWRNFEDIIKNKYSNPSIDPRKCSLKMHAAYLELCNQPIPIKIDEKRKAVMKQKESLAANTCNIKQMSVKPIMGHFAF